MPTIPVNQRFRRLVGDGSVSGAAGCQIPQSTLGSSRASAALMITTVVVIVVVMRTRPADVGMSMIVLLDE